MIIIIDRFEGSYAVVELPNKKMVNLPKDVLPGEAREGSVIRIEIDQAETDIRKDRIANMMTNLFKD